MGKNHKNHCRTLLHRSILVRNKRIRKRLCMNDALGYCPASFDSMFRFVVLG